MSTDRRLIEDYLPIEAISIEASGEPRTKGHIFITVNDSGQRNWQIIS